MPKGRPKKDIKKVDIESLEETEQTIKEEKEEVKKESIPKKEEKQKLPKEKKIIEENIKSTTTSISASLRIAQAELIVSLNNHMNKNEKSKKLQQRILIYLYYKVAEKTKDEKKAKEVFSKLTHDKMSNDVMGFLVDKMLDNIDEYFNTVINI